MPIESPGIVKDTLGFREGDDVFLEIASGFGGVPREHINVYTLSRSEGQVKEPQRRDR